MNLHDHDVTGVLTLDRVTPVITALFGTFVHRVVYPADGKGCRIEVSETAVPLWKDILKALIALEKDLEIQVPHYLTPKPSMAMHLILLAAHLRADDRVDLHQLCVDHTFDGDADLAHLFMIATSLDDGHGLFAIRYQGAPSHGNPLLACLVQRKAIFSTLLPSLYRSTVVHARWPWLRHWQRNSATHPAIN